MGIMRDFAMDLAEALGLPNINQAVLEIGQEILSSRGNPIELMKIAKKIRKERFIRICSYCRRFESGGRWMVPELRVDYWNQTRELIYPQGQQTHCACPECFKKEMAKLKAV